MDGRSDPASEEEEDVEDVVMDGVEDAEDVGNGSRPLDEWTAVHTGKQDEEGQGCERRGGEGGRRGGRRSGNGVAGMKVRARAAGLFG